MHLRALLLLLLLLLPALTLGGCSSSTVVTDWTSEDVAGPEPANYRNLVVAQLDNIVGAKDRHIKVLEISPPRRADLIKGASWLVCVRSAPTSSQLPPEYYGVIIQREKIVESRIAVFTDECEAQPYAPVEGSSPKPK